MVAQYMAKRLHVAPDRVWWHGTVTLAILAIMLILSAMRLHAGGEPTAEYAIMASVLSYWFGRATRAPEREE